MIKQFNILVDQYLKWLRDRTVLREINDWVEITTPFLDRHNDYLQLYAKKENADRILITDDGFTIDDLESCGCKLDTPKRQELLTLTLNGYGIELENGKLVAHADQSNFPLKKHNLIQAILSVNDLFYLSTSNIASFFFEDIEKWLDLNEIRHTSKIKFTGKSGFDHQFDFVVPKSTKQPERIIKAINVPNRETANSLVFAWIDTKDVRAKDSTIYAFLNDTNEKPSTSVIDALETYDVRPILWSGREGYRKVLEV